MTNIKDVAKAAGVSVATVSRTLRRPEKVSPEMRKTVLAAVAATNYHPNILAQRFRTRKSDAIMVLVSNLTNPFYARVISGIQTISTQRGYTVLLGETGGDVQIENRYASFAATKQVDGIIQLSHNVPEVLQEMIVGEKPFPYVHACEFLDNSPFATIGIDNSDAFFHITSRLIALGHRKIAVIAGPQENPVSAGRIKGLHHALQSHGIDISSVPVLQGDFTLESGALATELILSRYSNLTAILCFNDEMAIGSIHALKQKGIRVPDDISISGFDNIEFAKYCDPPLTTVAQPTINIGKTAAQILFDMMAGIPSQNTHVRLGTELIIRSSIKPI